MARSETLRFPPRSHPNDLANGAGRCLIKPGEVRHLNKRSGRPRLALADKAPSTSRKRHDPGVVASGECRRRKHLIRCQPWLALPYCRLRPLAIPGIPSLRAGSRCGPPLCWPDVDPRLHRVPTSRLHEGV